MATKLPHESTTSRVHHLIAHPANALLPLDTAHHHSAQLLQRLHMRPSTGIASQPPNIHHSNLFTFCHRRTFHTTNTLLLRFRRAPEMYLNLHPISQHPRPTQELKNSQHDPPPPTHPPSPESPPSPPPVSTPHSPRTPSPDNATPSHPSTPPAPPPSPPDSTC